jgi:hypothetical protein
LIPVYSGIKEKDAAAIEALEKNFECNTDYTSLNLKVKRAIGGSIKVQINLTADCFKAFCMMAGTAPGESAGY